jgi:alkylated DNA repair dioxygenase AlkB
VRERSTTLDLFGAPHLPEGTKYQPDFLVPEEEHALLRHVERLPFSEFEFHGFTGKRRTVSFGWRYDFNGGGLTKTEDMPEVLSELRARAETFAGSASGSFQQVLVTEYAPGAGIGWHKDRSVFGHVVGISLLSPCTFRLRRRKKRIRANEPRCRAALHLSSAGSLAHQMAPQHSRRRKPALLTFIPQRSRRARIIVARVSTFPKRLQPMLATLTDAPFDDKGWIFEDKYDGFRMVAKIEGGKVTLYSRNGKIISKSYIEVAKALEGVKADAVIDGELVALGKDGVSHFQLLQNALRHEAKLQYCAFDLMFKDGEDLRRLPLTERKKRLKAILPEKQADRVQPRPEDIWDKIFRGSRAEGSRRHHGKTRGQQIPVWRTHR